MEERPFEGLRFYIDLGLEGMNLDEEIVPKVIPRINSAVERLGAVRVDEAAGATHVVIPYQAIEQGLALDGARPRPQVCSVLWLCASLEAGQLLNPNAHPLYRPFRQASIPGAYGSACITGLSNLSRRLAVLLLIRMGYEPKLSFSAAPLPRVLIADNPLETTNSKINAARDLNVPVVSFQWVLDCLQRGELLPYARYLQHIQPAQYIFNSPVETLEHINTAITAAVALPERGDAGEAVGEAPAEVVVPEQAPAAEGAKEITTTTADVTQNRPSSGSLESAGARVQLESSGPGSGPVGGATQAMNVVGNLAALLYDGESPNEMGAGGLILPLQAAGRFKTPQKPEAIEEESSVPDHNKEEEEEEVEEQQQQQQQQQEKGAEKEQDETAVAVSKQPSPVAANDEMNKTNNANTSDKGKDNGDNDNVNVNSGEETPSDLSVDMIPSASVVEVEGALLLETQLQGEEGMEDLAIVDAAHLNTTADQEQQKKADENQREEVSLRKIPEGVGAGAGAEEDIDIDDEDDDDAFQTAGDVTIDDTSGGAGGGDDDEEYIDLLPTAALPMDWQPPDDDDDANEKDEDNLPDYSEPAEPAEVEQQKQLPASKAGSEDEHEHEQQEQKQQKQEEEEERPTTKSRSSTPEPRHRLRKQRGPARAEFSQPLPPLVPARDAGARNTATTAATAATAAAGGDISGKRSTRKAAVSVSVPATRQTRNRGTTAAVSAVDEVDEPVVLVVAPVAVGRSRRRKDQPLSGIGNQKDKEKEFDVNEEEQPREEEEEANKSIKNIKQKKTTATPVVKRKQAPSAPVQDTNKNKKAKTSTTATLKNVPSKRKLQEKNHTSVDEEDAPTENKEGRPSPREVCIALSGLHSQEQSQLSTKLKALNIPCVSHSQSQVWKPHFTHVVAPGMKRNVKCCAALAAGAWLVAPSFVEAASQVGHLGDEEPHELKDAPSNGDGEQNLAPHWRQRRSSTGAGAFSGLRIALGHLSPQDAPPSREEIKIILEAGGATVLPISLLASSSSSSSRSNKGKAKNASFINNEPLVDLVITSTETVTKNAAVQRLIEGGALCVSSKYVIDWLFKPHGSLQQHVLLGSKAGKKVAAMVAERKQKGPVKKKLPAIKTQSPSTNGKADRVEDEPEPESPQF